MLSFITDSWVDEEGAEQSIRNHSTKRCWDEIGNSIT